MEQRWRPERYRGKWAAVIGRGNGKRSVATGASERAGAEAFCRRLNAQLEAEARGRGPVTVDRLMELYIIDRRARGTVNVARMHEVRRALKPVWGHYHPDELDTALCRAYVDRGRRRGLSDATIRQELAYLQAALNYAVECRLIERAPKLEKPPAPRPREHYLTREEVRRLIDACDTPHAALFVALAISTAGRPKHLLELRWSQVDLTRRVLNLDRPDVDRTRKGRARVPLNDLALEHLRLARDMAETAYVIEWQRKPVKSIKKAIASAAKKAGVEATPYVLRHSAGVWMAQAGVPLEQIAEYMGHEDLNTTRKHYARFHPDHLQAASRALEV